MGTISMNSKSSKTFEPQSTTWSLLDDYFIKS